MIRRRALAFVVAAALVATTGLVQAEPTTPSDADRAAARQMGEDAVAAYKAGDLAKAHDLFKRAHAIVGLTTTGLYMARCLAGLGRLVEASERYMEVTRMTLPDDALPIHEDAKVTAKKERDALLPRIPKLTVNLAGGDASAIVLTLDGVEVPSALHGVGRPTDPGDHVIVATRGAERQERRITLAEGSSETLTIELAGAAPALAPAPEPEPDSAAEQSSLLPTLGWIAIGVGGAGIVVGAISGALALDKRSSLEKACPEMECTPELHGDVDTYQTLRIVSGVGLIAGGVLAATGIVLVAVSAASTEQPAVSVTITPGGLGLRGAF